MYTTLSSGLSKTQDSIVLSQAKKYAEKLSAHLLSLKLSDEEFESIVATMIDAYVSGDSSSLYAQKIHLTEALSLPSSLSDIEKIQARSGVFIPVNRHGVPADGFWPKSLHPTIKNYKLNEQVFIFELVNLSFQNAKSAGMAAYRKQTSDLIAKEFGLATEHELRKLRQDVDSLIARSNASTPV